VSSRSRAARWVIATSNPGKIDEFQALLAGAGVELLAQSTLGIVSPPETGSTFVENALLKARHAADASGLPAIADDSGLVVDALDGAPGIHSARYAGVASSAGDNVAKLLAALREVPASRRQAHFHCVIVALMNAADPAPLIAEGIWHGEIALAPVGAGGFGYDPVFFDPTLGVTAGEMAAAAKNRVSHRGQALHHLVDWLGRQT
jgi:XTP/dITP diphosphohydrolase